RREWCRMQRLRVKRPDARVTGVSRHRASPPPGAEGSSAWAIVQDEQPGGTQPAMGTRHGRRVDTCKLGDFPHTGAIPAKFFRAFHNAAVREQHAPIGRASYAAPGVRLD